MLKMTIRATLPKHTHTRLQGIAERSALGPAARREMKYARYAVDRDDPGIANVIPAITVWLCRAQDNAASNDGGFARDFDLNKGWSESCPETSGYIVPTLIDEAGYTQNEDLLDRARRALDWLVSIQHADGGFQGGTVSQQPRVSVTFNTGQILPGLAAGAARFGDARYLASMHAAAGFLVESQDKDGAWRRHPTPFAEAGDKTHETHLSWGLFEAERIAPGHGYGDAGLKQVRWALGRQRANGWFADNDLQNSNAPLTHTIGYILRDMMEAYRLSREQCFLDGAQKTADALLMATLENGDIAGKLDSDWRPAVDFVCLTGSAQIAACWLLLGCELDRPDYIDAARRANAFVRRTINVVGDINTRGGVKGSYPVDGGYGRFQYLNRAAKFTLDAQRMEYLFDS